MSQHSSQYADITGQYRAVKEKTFRITKCPVKKLKTALLDFCPLWVRNYKTSSQAHSPDKLSHYQVVANVLANN